MATQLIATHRVNAEIYHREDLCKQKSLKLLDEICLPNGSLHWLRLAQDWEEERAQVRGHSTHCFVRVGGHCLRGEAPNEKGDWCEEQGAVLLDHYLRYLHRRK
ncbi:hypothetical protein QN277_010206 [Acacia crassicarpa]|uniref:Uncharacterized protein n=1 Tax=Acacia crassicarpa TaxID=499986 RepID=A0AAE1IPD4_9FABA|nr:hypothetical protein QN277_010206 [Acacia crassicarpa]